MIKLPDITLVYVVICFLIARAILKRYLFEPLSAILEERSREERMAAKVCAESLEELSRTIARVEEELSRARREALKERENMRAQGRAYLERELAEVRAAANASIERGSQEIEREAVRSAAELPQEARGLARAFAEKILGRKLAA